ncbi:geranylgeranyl pyrophosphate synthase [Actinoalloteichus sp. GBA129-24]|uniref:Geranylgeranyl pyrophosphate synthase n=1 Tax=Actinoalloteichus fjordicus TaxID=1612552 RepID=A0AAC9L7H5_9PSEU|nr:geranylgeranyl pyrophosphate synthase [Actinoalloteichus fjordicus]APU18566.1 geranylgeranyl pyrophosphate synthase [Actinoalloteichus sp. GBA129-24]
MAGTGRTQVGGGRTSQLDIADAGLAEDVSASLAEVEDLLHGLLRSDLDFVTETALHLVDAGGKRFRPMFTLLAAQFGGQGRPDVIKAAVAVELVHLATLYHDDVMDEATMRRGAQSANVRWDNAVAILTGDYLFARASYLVADLGTEVARIIAQTFGELVTGQMRETVGPSAGADPIEHYLRVITEKTGSLIATAGQYGAMLSGAPDEQIAALRRLGQLIGIAFQISDDIIDIDSPAQESGKVPGTDLREGVLTLPMLYALAEESPQTARLRELLAGPVGDDELVQEALDLLRASSGVTAARKTLTDYADAARQELAVLPAHPARDALGSLIEYVVARSN